jgi:hypothetical protein
MVKTELVYPTTKVIALEVSYFYIGSNATMYKN